jgi:hypothetical protein
MEDKLICPRCGAENLADAMNCVACRINLGYAREHPDEIEPMEPQDAHWLYFNTRPQIAQSEGTAGDKNKPILLPILLLLGSFVFAFCLGEAVHEFGHFLVHRINGVSVGIRLDPFGGSKILNGSSAPREIMGITSLAGPLLNLLLGSVVSLSLWRIRKPILLPLLLWGPTALVQEGVTFSLGMLTPGGDAQFIVEWGVPAGVLISLGILFLALGVALICWLLPLVNLSSTDSSGRKFGIVLGGMVSFFVLRLVVSSMRSSSAAMENTVPLIFSILLATVVVALYKPFNSILGRISRTKLASVTWPATSVSLALGVGMIVLQLFALN